MEQNTFLNKILYALVLSALAANNADASLAARMKAARELNAQKLVEKHQVGLIDEQTAIANAKLFGLGDITEKLTPKDWSDFFLRTENMNYAALLDGADKLSRNTGDFKAEISQVTAVINGETLLAWLNTWRDAAFGDILTDSITHRKKINRMVKAVEARDAFAHLMINPALISKAVFDIMDANNDVTLKQAYETHIGAIDHRGTNITNDIATHVVDNQQHYATALQRAKVAPEVAYWRGLNRGFTLVEANTIADRIINQGDAEVVALQRVVQAQARFNALNDLTVAQRVLAGRTLDQAHRDLTIAATKVDLAGRFANVAEDLRGAMSERMYDAALAENAALRAVLVGLENTGLKHSNSIHNLADAMLAGLGGTSLEDAVETVERAFVEGTLAIANLHYLQNNDVLVLMCMGSDTIDAGIRTFCSTIVGDELAGAFEDHLKALHRRNFAVAPYVQADERNAFFRAHVRTRLDSDHNNLDNGLKNRIATALATANTPTANITPQVVAAALVAEDAVTYGGENIAFGRAIAAKLLSVDQPNLGAASRLVHIDMKAQEIQGIYGHLPLDECQVLATNFIDQARGLVNEHAMKLALAAFPNVDALDPEGLADFQAAVLEGRTIENALKGNVAALKKAISEFDNGIFAHIVDDELDLLSQKFMELGYDIAEITHGKMRASVRALFVPAIVKDGSESQTYWSKIIDENAPKGLVAAFTASERRLYDIDLKEKDIEAFKPELNPAMTKRIAMDFVDENRAGVSNDSLRAALVHLMTPLALDNDLRNFYMDQVLEGGDLIDLLDNLREKLLWNASLPLLATYNDVDTLLAHVPDELRRTENDQIAFAKMVQEETLRLDDDVRKKVKATLQLCEILRDEGLDLTALTNQAKEGAREAREHIYGHRRFLMEEAQKKQAKIVARRLSGERGLLDVPQPSDDMQDVNLFKDSLGILKTALPGGNVNSSVSLSFEVALKAWTLKHNLDLDKTKYAKMRIDHHDALAIQVAGEEPILSGGGENVNFGQERNAALTQLENLDREKENDTLKLNYVNFTLEDNISYTLAADIPTVNTGYGSYYLQLKTDLQAFLNRYADNTERLNGLPTIRQQNKADLESAFTRFAGGTDNWSGKIYALLTRVPENLVDSTIVRPTPLGEDDLPGYDANAWKNALDEQTYIILQDVIGSNLGCDTGVNRKLELVLSARAMQMGLDAPELGILQKVAGVKLGLKEDRITELGSQYNPVGAEETIIQTTQVGAQRMKSIFSLPGTYTRTPYASMGGPEQDQNKPEQIIRNLFVGAQPNRVCVSHYYNQVDANRLPLEVGTAVAPHLTVKSYLAAVHAKFNKDDFVMMRDSLPEVLLDYNLHQLTQYDANFVQHKSTSAFYDQEGQPTLALTAFFMDYIGEITILPAVKTATCTQASDIEAINIAKEADDDFDPTACAYKRKYGGKTLLDLIDDF